MGRTNQRGSTLGFIIIGVILAVLLVGGAYIVRQKTSLSADAANQPAPIRADDKAKNDDKKQPASTQDDQKTAPKREQTPSSDQKSADTPTHELPHTGPAEALMAILGIGLLTATTTAYLQSRRLAASL